MPRRQTSSARRNHRRSDDEEVRCLAGVCGFVVYVLVRGCIDAFLDHADEDNMNGTWSPLDSFGLFILLMFFFCVCTGIITNSANNENRRDQQQRRGASSIDIEDQRSLRQPLLSNDNNEERSAEIQSELDWYSRARELMENSNGAVTSFTEALRLVEEQDQQTKKGEEALESLEGKEEDHGDNENNVSIDSKPAASLQESCPKEEKEKEENNASSDIKPTPSSPESHPKETEEETALATRL